MPRCRLASTANPSQPRATINAAWSRLLPGLDQFVREWAGLRRDEIRANWERARRNEQLLTIGPGDLVMNVILGVPFAAGALQPGGDDQPRRLEQARLPVADPGAVVAAAGDPAQACRYSRAARWPGARSPGTSFPGWPSTRRPAGRPPGGRGVRSRGSRRAAPRWTWRTRRSGRCRRRAGGSPARPRVPARSAARRSRAARPPSAGQVIGEGRVTAAGPA